MRKDEPIFVGGGTENPDYDFDIHEMRVRYYIGPEDNPDEVIVVEANGDYRVDDALKDELRAIAPADTQVDVRDALVAPMGGPWYDLMLWLAGAVGAGVIGNGAWDGLSTLKEKLRSNTHQFSSPKLNADQLAEFRPVAELQVLQRATKMVTTECIVQGTLTSIGVDITNLHSRGNIAATVVLRDSGGSTFTVVLEYDNGWRQSRIIKVPRTPTEPEIVTGDGQPRT